MENLASAIAALRATPRGGPLDWALEYVQRSGKRHASTYEWETRFELDGSGSAKLFRRRGPGDSHKLAPGSYRGNLAENDLLDFLATLAASGIDQLRSETPNPRDPVNLFRVLIQGRLFAFSWGVLKPPVPLGVLQLRNELSRLGKEACPIPEWNLALSVESMTFEHGLVKARLRIVNTGSREILIALPASGGLGGEFGLHLKYGEAQLIEEGATPAPFEAKYALMDGTGQLPSRFEAVQPGIPYPIEFSAALEGTAPRGWVGRFGFLHYLASDTVAGKPVFNGALFSEEKSW